MTSYLRKTDTSFRYGGDEFAVIIQEHGSNKAEGLVDRLNQNGAHAQSRISLA